jgi:AcrR family transcriptional regulator
MTGKKAVIAPPPSRAKGSDRSTRERLLNAAFAVFRKRGFSGASTIEIATRARVSKRDLYALFSSKHAMLTACIRERTSRMRRPVELAAPTPLATGTYRWISITARLDDDVAILDLEQRLRSEPDLSRLIVRLQLEGHLSIAAHTKLQERIVDLKAALFHLDLDQSGLLARPAASDLEAIDFDGVLRRCADRLKSLVDDKSQTAEARHRAEEALVELYLKAAMPGSREAA